MSLLISAQAKLKKGFLDIRRNLFTRTFRGTTYVGKRYWWDVPAAKGFNNAYLFWGGDSHDEFRVMKKDLHEHFTQIFGKMGEDWVEVKWRHPYYLNLWHITILTKDDYWQVIHKLSGDQHIWQVYDMDTCTR